MAKLNPAGAEIVYAVYGRANGESPVNIAVDSAGEIHLLATQFPNPNNLVQFLVRKYTADGTGIVYETPFATDASWMYPMPIPLDDQGVATVAGSIAAIGFPIHDATASCASPGATNTYVVRLSSGGDILQSTFLTSNGGPAIAFAMNVQSAGGYIAVETGFEQLGILRIGPDTAGTAGTALGCYGNGATFLGGPLAPGEVFTMFGEGLGPAAGTTIQWGSHQPVGASLGA